MHLSTTYNIGQNGPFLHQTPKKVHGISDIHEKRIDTMPNLSMPTTRATTSVQETLLLKPTSRTMTSISWTKILLVTVSLLCTSLVQSQSFLNSGDVPGGRNLLRFGNQRAGSQPQRDADSLTRPKPVSVNSQDWQASSHDSSNSKPYGRPFESPLSFLNLTASSESDTLSEGSGNGPVPVAKHKSEKFDDTEDGDDDDEADDYDYKEGSDVGSGHGNVIADANKKSDMVIQGSQPINKPNRDEADIYLPYRPPSTASNNTSMVQLTTLPPISTNFYVTTQTNTRLPTLEVPKINSSMQVMDIVPSKINSSQTFSYDSALAETAPNKPVINTSLKNSTLIKNNQTQSATTETPKQIILTTTQSATVKTQSSSSVTSAPSLVSKFHPSMPGSRPSNNSAGSRYNSSSKVSDSDYDYEEDNDDDDSEDNSNFEDNENADSSINKTATLSTESPSRSTQSVPKSDSKYIGAGQSAVPSTSYKPFTSAPPIPVSTSLTPNTRPTSTTPARVAISSTTTISPPEYDNEEDESSEEDEEYDESENDMEEEDDEANDNQDMLPSSTPIPTRSSTQSVRWTTPRPIMPHRPNYDNPTTYYDPPRVPSSQTTEFPGAQIKNHPTLAPIPPTVLPTTRTTSATTLRSTVVWTASNIASSVTTSPTMQWKTTNIPTTVKPATTPMAPIRQPTGPKSRVTPLDVLAYGKNLQDDDANLTRQIYDKAVEVYRATSQAVTSAVDAIWPTKFELNARTFEPLLAQPFLFMFALGAAVVGLVLTMMLVVYIVTYQIQPKDDISIYD